MLHVARNGGFVARASRARGEAFRGFAWFARLARLACLARFTRFLLGTRRAAGTRRGFLLGTAPGRPGVWFHLDGVFFFIVVDVLLVLPKAAPMRVPKSAGEGCCA